jgi:flagellar basal-body rod protein FlgB
MHDIPLEETRGEKMIDSGAYNYINVLQQATNASWLRNTILSNNIANVDTPHYKRKDVQFETYLIEQMAGGDSLDENVDTVDLSTLNGTIYTDNSTLSYRMDGNNVDIDTENVELAKNQIKYNVMTDSISQEFSRLRTAMGK